jgi:parallel beta-helix repeat protein
MVRGRLRIRAVGGTLLVICLLLALPAAASAATTDFAYGAGVSGVGTPFGFSARSGADGSSPSGRVILGGIFGNSEGPVTCLRVQGNVAAIGYRVEKSSVPSLVGKGFVVYMQDNGPFLNAEAVDKGDAGQVAQAPTSCPAPTAAQANSPLYGEVSIGDDSALPPPPADPTWSISKGSIPFGALTTVSVAAMRSSDGSAIGYAAMTGEESEMYGKVVCLDVDGRTAITGIDKDFNRSLILENAAQIATIDGRATGGSTGSDSLSIGLVEYPGDSGEVDCKPPYPDPRALTSGDVVTRSGAPLPPPPVRCGQTIKQDTTVQGDLHCDTRYGIRIGAPGITLDLAGHSVSAHSVSILNHGYDDVTIKNGSVGVSTTGIDLQGVSGNLIRDVELSGLQRGIYLTGSDNNRIVSNRLLSVWISLQNGSDDNVIRDNTLLAYESFIAIHNSSRNRVLSNVISNGQETGVVLNLADHTLVSENDITAINGGGVGLTESDDNQVSDNVVHGRPNGENPIEVEGVRVTNSHRNLLLRNGFLDNTIAIHVVSGWANTLRRNQALLGVADGFLVDAPAVGTTLQRNFAFGFDDDGFDVESPSTRLGNNTANYNDDLGIEAVPGVTDLGGNEATGNDNPAQCVNVVCQ